MANPRKFREPSLIIGTQNQAKVRELTHLLAPFGINVIPASTLDIVEPEETGQTFEENSRTKALFYSKATGMPALADDSGICINALGGTPGIHSARWAGPEKDYGIACARIQDELRDKMDRSASFECALALAWPDEHIEVFKGTVEGKIIEDGRGSNGFAYDPIFIPKGGNRTFAEMGDDEKSIISHRAMALESLIANCLAE